MPFTPTPRPEGQWVPMRELCKLKQTIAVTRVTEAAPVFEGEAKPQHVVSFKDGDDDWLVGVSKGPADAPYSRDLFFAELADYLADNPGEAVKIKFVPTKSNFIDVVCVD